MVQLNQYSTTYFATKNINPLTGKPRKNKPARLKPNEDIGDSNSALTKISYRNLRRLGLAAKQVFSKIARVINNYLARNN